MFTRKHKLLASTFFTLSAGGLFGFFSNAIQDEDSIVELILTRLWGVILLWSIYLAYENTFGYKTTQKWWKNLIGCLACTAILFLITSFSLQGIFTLVNANLGNQRLYPVKARLIKRIQQKQKAGNTTYELTILLDKDSIELKVNEYYFNKYLTNDTFYEQMQIGSLGGLYKR